MTDGLRVEIDGPVATITLDRPDALNALTVPVKVALREALESLDADHSVRAVILTGTGRAFCAGQDLAERERPDAAPLEVEVRERYNPIIRALRSMGQPVIAAVNGVAAGAGASLAFACDLRIASEEARALADTLAGGAPLANALTKQALQRSMTIDLDEALEGEAKLQGIAGRSADHAEGLAAFREKRRPRFGGN